ncbi:MAG: hypothetical protein WCS17_10380 [Prevotella sp.]
MVDCKHTLMLRLTRLEIIVQQILKAQKYIVVQLMTLRKLPVIEAHAIVKQQFDVVAENLT